MKRYDTDMDAECFAKAIEKEVASFEAERAREREAKALEQKNRDTACRVAMRVSREVVLPLLSGLRDAFAKGKMLPRWEVGSSEETGKYSATCRSCPSNPGDLNFCIRAAVEVQEGGTKLGFSLVCECEDPLKTAQSRTKELPQGECPSSSRERPSKASELHAAGGYSPGVADFNMTDAHRWFYNELEKSAVACVREKQKQVV